MRRFGSKVTVVDRNGRLMSKADLDICDALRSLLADEGVDILLNARIKQVSGKCGDSVCVIVEQNGIEKVLKGTHVLVATGRNPNTEGLGLELTGVKLTDRGYIKINERLQTTAPGVWAIGEVAGSPQFTHISIDDFRVVHANLTGGNRVTTGSKSHIVCLPTPNLLV
jgi:pyruvate/2-oxoglutarate dehydrogenase complex dihydrolipoamide dehydrogenase (E3) component